jgi:5-methylcytosine-specific restriction endonuclease McrA
MPESVHETAISLKNRTDRHVAAQLNVPYLITRPPIQRKNCWNKKNNTDFIDTVSRGWSCSPIFIIQQESESDEQELFDDHVFDGAHKIEAVILFINGGFELDKVNDTSPLKEYVGKKFVDMPLALRTKILNYQFTINIIDPETANDKDSLKILWHRLNNSGKKLNDFELALPVIRDLNMNVLKPSLDLFLKSQLFTKDKSQRGEAEKLLQIILAISESELTEPHMKDFTSKKDMVKRWQTNFLGDKMLEIKEKTAQNSDKWKNILKLASDYMKYLAEANCFVNAKGETIMQSAHRGTELVFLLGRLVYHFPRPENFRRICSDLASEVKEKYFKTIIRDEAGRNGILQKRILRELDTLIQNYCKDIPKRTFTKEQIAKKLEEQGGKCAQCKEAILKNQSYHADHIIPWGLGGDSSDENCQVSHKRCNLIKGKRQDLNDLSAMV